jgi:HD-GYP domain-containing protein (c-di-GMP phosphodiesterase class II)
MTTRFRTRAFFFCFVPFAMLLAGSFWMVQRLVQSTVRDGMHASLRESQIAMATIHANGDLQNSRSLKLASENSVLKAEMQQLLSDRKGETARRTVEDQLRELGEQMGFDFMVASAADGSPLAGVVRQPNNESRGKLVPLDTDLLYRSDAHLRVLGGRILQVTSVTVDENDEDIGSLSVGKYFNFSDITTPVALVLNGKVIESNIPKVPLDEMERALAQCRDQSECDVRLKGSSWIAMPIQSYGGGYTLLNFESVDEATASIKSKLNNLFLTLAIICMLLALLCSIASSNSIVKPIATVVSHLRSAARTGVLPELEGQSTSILEIRELTEIYNRAAASVRESSENLEAAYFEFVGSLANALDARDPYTAGHSRRVSELSCAIAAALGLGQTDIDRIRVGALLHDIGKIGIADTVLQKRGRLTGKELALVKQHPVIGRRILVGVRGFAPFLGAVELHHENWDGSGYPWGQAGEETLIDARIIHVADAYDAMTSDRSYRRGMDPERALSILGRYAGTQFDPLIVEVFARFAREILIRYSARPERLDEAKQPASAVNE